MKEENLVEEERRSLSRSTGLVSFATALSRVTGLISFMVVFKALGFNRLQDSYNLANVMPNMIFELIAGGILTSVLIPVYISRRLEDESAGRRTANNIINITFFFLSLMALLGTVFSYDLVRIQTFLVPPSKVSVATANFFFKFFVWEIVFYGLTAVFNAILQAHRRFTVPALAPMFNNLVVIVTVVFFYLPLRNAQPELALRNLALGTTLGIAAMALVQLPYLLKTGWRYAFVIDFSDPAFKRLALLALPVVAYVAANQIALTVSNNLAWDFTGGMTAFKGGWQFFQLPYGLLAVSISTVLFPRLAERAALKDLNGLKKTVALGVNSTAFIIIPASVGLFLLAVPISDLIYIGLLKSPNVNAEAARQIAGVMAYFMAGLLPFSLFMFLNRVFYALNDTKTPMWVNAAGVPLNIALDFGLVALFGIAGLAMGHSLTYLVTMTLLFMALRRKIGKIDARAMLRGTIKFTLISGVMGVIIVLLARWLGGWETTAVLRQIGIIAAATLFGGGFYILANVAMKSEEVAFLTGVFKGRKNRGD